MISDNCDYELDEVPDWQAFRKLGKLNLMTPTQHREDQEMKYYKWKPGSQLKVKQTTEETVLEEVKP